MRILTTLFVVLSTGLISVTLSAQLSSRYTFVAGHGEVSWRHTAPLQQEYKQLLLLQQHG